MTAPVPADTAPIEAVLGADGLYRCPWATGDPLMLSYHDTEWGIPVHGEQALFERVSLEGFQAGLSWLTVLRKRPAFRTAFANFRPEAAASFTDDDIELLLTNTEIIRNRAKIEAVRSNAQAVLDLRAEGGLDRFLWSYSDPTALQPETADAVPSQTEASVRMARDLKARGFKFVGPTTCLALMEATGMVNTHLLACHRRAQGSSDLKP